MATKGQPKKRETKSTYKTRNWATVIYPESEKPNWRDILRGWCCQAFVSPLHDADKNPDETPKKPHYHVLMMYDGPRSAATMAKAIEELGGVGCQPCNSARGYARYLCHLDNPEKAQYDMAAVEAFGGADYLGVIQLETDRRETISEMCDWCRETGCVSFAALSDYARKERPVWWQALTAHSTMFMFRYVRALEDEIKEGRQFAGDMRPEANADPESVREVDPLDVARAQVANAETALLAARERLNAMERKEGGKPPLPGRRPESGAGAEGGEARE